MFGPLLGGLLGGAISGGIGLIGANQQRKQQQALAQQQMDLYREQMARAQEAFGAGPEISFEDLLAAAQDAARWNAGEGTDLANQSADKINAQSLKDLEEGLRQLYGGTAYDDQRKQVNTNVQDWLAGNLSAGAKNIVARQALATGMGNPMGGEGISDLYAGYLGQATEDLATKGVSAYSSLYSMYRQAYPLVTGAQILPVTTYSPEAAANDRLGMAQLEFSYQQAAVNGQNMAGNMALQSAQTAAGANDGMWQVLSAVGGQLGGAVSAAFQPRTTGMTSTVSPDGRTTTYTPIQTGGWKSWFGGSSAPAAATVPQASVAGVPATPGQTQFYRPPTATPTATAPIQPANEPFLPWGDTTETSAMLLPPLAASRRVSGWGVFA